MKCSPDTTSGLSLGLACFQRSRPAASTASYRALSTGSLAVWLRRTCSGLAAYDFHGLLGIKALRRAWPPPSPTARSWQSRVGEHAVVAPWGIRGVSSPLIRKTSELSAGLPAVTILWSGVPV